MTRLKQNKIFNYLLVASLFLAFYIWTTVWQNASADIKPDEVKISFLDVGQGDAALVSLGKNQQVLIDTGKPGTLLAPLSRRMPAFDRSIEAVFLSHPDNDHSGGFAELAQSFEIGKLYFNRNNQSSQTVLKINKIIDERQIPVEEVERGETFFFDEVRIDALWPSDLSKADNDNSQVLKISAKSSKALFTGDLEFSALSKLTTVEDDLSADLLKFPHHGSAGAYNGNFMNKVGAKNVVISSGKNNPYGHPSKTVLEGLEGLGTKIFRTDQLGTIDFVSSDKGWAKR